VPFGKPANKAVLDEIIGRDDIAGERTGVPTQSWYFGFNPFSEVGHSASPVFCDRHIADPERVKSTDARQPDDDKHASFCK